jgi:peptidoglycan/LPS O-acetylase OafA/YrhL
MTASSSNLFNQKHSFHPSIDGLRAISVLAVVIYHVDSTALSGGYRGVDAFFVVSGFLITRLVLQDFQIGAF